MANSRIMLVCKHCGEGMVLGKGYFGNYFTAEKDKHIELNEFFEKHSQGSCVGDCDYSDNARKHFVILEECETLEDLENIVEVVRCKDCDVPHNKWLGCPHLNGLIPPPDFYCAKGTPKERGTDKPKITCLNCKHFMFSDMYGECNKQFRIVHPSDTCEYAEPKEKGGAQE